MVYAVAAVTSMRVAAAQAVPRTSPCRRRPRYAYALIRHVATPAAARAEKVRYATYAPHAALPPLRAYANATSPAQRRRYIRRRRLPRNDASPQMARTLSRVEAVAGARHSEAGTRQRRRRIRHMPKDARPIRRTTPCRCRSTGVAAYARQRSVVATAFYRRDGSVTYAYKRQTPPHVCCHVIRIQTAATLRAAASAARQPQKPLPATGEHMLPQRGRLTHTRYQRKRCAASPRRVI
ncbi:hypothetical protein TNCT_373441 [Trichonephila clavata]|uniref:Uncharacterized protein n=1 Tax=Trichonephila clavata TaxID=2740835 RepID=A0A8X6FF59_TRICU|nr:hypothetical protein TNCT_373441 [Trichonephila clavata]